MTLRNILLLFSFTILCFSNAFFYTEGYEVFKLTSNILIIPSILFYYRLVAKLRSVFFQVALLFSWIGDVFFIFNEQEIFVKLSVICYFFTQVFLILETYKYLGIFNYRFLSMGILLFASYLIIFLNQVYAYLGEMKIYAIVYGVTISYLGCISFMYFFQKQTRLRFFLFFGVLIYSFRDVILTFNVKVFEEETYSYLIPLFYGIALFFITRFFIDEHLPNHKDE